MPLWRFPLFEPRLTGGWDSMFLLRLILTEDERGSDAPAANFIQASYILQNSCIGNMYTSRVKQPLLLCWISRSTASVVKDGVSCLSYIQEDKYITSATHTHGRTSLG